MATLPETPTYTAGIYQLEIVDAVLGGASGISNTQAQQLANRTSYLKQHMDTAETNISNNTSAIALKAPLASPNLTGTPTAPTATAGTNTTQLATTAFVTTAITNLNIANYAPLASPAFTGTPTAPTAAAGTSTTQLATTAFVTAADNLKAPLASPALTGTPTAPTATAGTNTTQLATTAFVSTAITNLSTTLTTSINTKWTKTGDQASGEHGINVAPVTNTGLCVQSANPDAGFALRVFGDMRVKPASTQTVDQALLYFQNKAGTWGSAVGLQTNNEVLRFYNNAGANVALVDNNGNYIGGNLEVGGTFTPAVAGSTTAGTATYTVQNGMYAITGNMVHYQLRVQWSGHTGTGNMRVTGLPQVILGTSSDLWMSDSVYAGSGLAIANTQIYAILRGSSQQIEVYSRLVTSTNPPAAQAMTATGDLIISGAYRYR